MRKITLVIILFAIIAGGLFTVIKMQKGGSGVIRDVVVYKPSMTIGSLYKGNQSFDDIDRSEPEGVLFCKTITEHANQVEKIYTKSTNESKIMEMIRTRGTTADFKKRISEKGLLFSYYYYGVYGPPQWFCLLETPGSTRRVPMMLELENGKWRQCTDMAKYPSRIAILDLGKKQGLYKAKNSITKKDIEVFIDKCRKIDEVIAVGMAEDPEQYSPVQKL